MDKWQQWIYDKCVICVNGLEDEVTISSSEAYVVMKALEDQQKFQNPMLEIPAEALSSK